MLFLGGQLLRGRPGLNTAGSVVAHPVHSRVIDGHVLDVDVGDVGATDVDDGRVVVQLSAAPVAAFVSAARVAEPVVHAAVEADALTPIAAVPQVGAACITPIAGGPQVARLRWLHPGTRYPDVVAGIRIP